MNAALRNPIVHPDIDSFQDPQAHSLLRRQTLHQLDLRTRATQQFQTLTPAPEGCAYTGTHLILRDRPQLAWGRSLPRDRAVGDVDGLPDLTAGGDPVTNLVRDDFDDRHARVVLVALVHAVAEVAKPCRDPVCGKATVRQS